jgi:hypothetical protein
MKHCNAASFEADVGPGEGVETQYPIVETPPFETTLVTSKEPLSKAIGFKDGKFKTVAAHRIWEGRARRLRHTQGMRGMADRLNKFTVKQAQTTGRLRADLDDDVELLTLKKLSKHPDAIARARKFFEFPADEPGIILADYDAKTVPQHVAIRLENLGGFEKAIYHVTPETKQAARLIRPSTSSGISNTQTGEIYPAGGIHLYILLKDGSDADRTIETLHARCWLNGLGWGALSKNGNFMERSLVDLTMRGPEHVCFEGPAVLTDKSLVQEPRKACAYEGLPLDSRQFIPDLTESEITEVDALKQAERERLKPESARLQTISRKISYDREIARGATHEEALRAVDDLQKFRVLPLSHLLYFNGWMDVAHILADPKKYANHYCADPEEGPDYGTTTAVLRVNEAAIFIDSFAHGAAAKERRFWLKNSEATLLETQLFWENLPADDPDWATLLGAQRDAGAEQATPPNGAQDQEPDPEPGADELGPSEQPGVTDDPEPDAQDHDPEPGATDDPAPDTQPDPERDGWGLSCLWWGACHTLPIPKEMMTETWEDFVKKHKPTNADLNKPEDLADYYTVMIAWNRTKNAVAPPLADIVSREYLLLSSWIKKPIPVRDYLLGGVLCTTSRWLIVGETGIGKTLIGLDMAAAIAAGMGVLGWAGQGIPRRVMYFDGELPQETFKERMQLIAERYGADIQLYGYNREALGDKAMPPFNTPEGQVWLRREIDIIKPDIIFFDSMMCLLSGSLKEEEAWIAMKPFIRELTARRIAQVWFNHANDLGKSFGDKTRGWEMDTIAVLTKANTDDEEDNAIRLEFTKARLRVPATFNQFRSMIIRPGDGEWEVERAPKRSKGKPGKVRNDLRREYLDAYTRLCVGVSESRGFDEWPVVKVDADAIREELKRRGFLDKSDDGSLSATGRSDLYRARADLLKAKTLVEDNGQIWRVH